MLELSELFETPLLVASLENAGSLNRALRAVIEIRQNGSPGMTGSNEGWESDKRMLEWGGEPAAGLIRAIVEAADLHTIDIGAKDKSRYAWVPEMWARVAARGDAGRPRYHPGSFWSAIYFVDDGYGGSADRRLGGEVELEDPRMPTLLMEGPDLRFRYSDNAPVASPEIQLRPATGRLLIFPSWLRQADRAYWGAAGRVSIHVNLAAAYVCGQSGAD